jgi:hypothetical protein
MKSIKNTKVGKGVLVILLFFLFFLFFLFKRNGIPGIPRISRFLSIEQINLEDFKKKENRMFPFRYFTDVNDKVLPFVAVTGFFRDSAAKERYYEYKSKGLNIFGITAYKSFPNNKVLGMEEGEYERKDTFDYTSEIKNWLCCFRNAHNFGFTPNNNIANISESDFYNAETDFSKNVKKYDFIYICNKDYDNCPLDGWNAINRNFELAKKCFPVLCNQFKLKGLVVGRTNCGLEKEYPSSSLEVIGWLDWAVLQEKMKECRILFVPNILDASPRVIAECITKNLAVLMNRDILCGFKYINYQTGEFFTNEVDLVHATQKILNRLPHISPAKWWEQNYSQEISQKRLRNFLADAFPQDKSLVGVERVRFIL